MLLLLLLLLRASLAPRCLSNQPVTAPEEERLTQNIDQQTGGEKKKRKRKKRGGEQNPERKEMGNCLKSPTSDDISLLHESQSDRASYGEGADPDQEPPPPYQVTLITLPETSATD